MSVKYFLIADLHWQKKTMDRLHQTFQWFYEEILKECPTRILILGDTFQHRNTIDIQVQDAMSSWIDKFLKVPCQPFIHFLTGNHDMIDLDSRTINSINVFQDRHSRVFVHNELEVIELDGERYIMAPYHHDQTPISTFLKAHIDSAKDIVVFGHLAVDSAVMYGATERSQRLCMNSGLTINQLEHFKRVFMGHFHFHKSYANNKVVYVGSPIQTDFGEAGNVDKGYVLFEPYADRWELKPSPFASFYITWTWSHFVTLEPASLAIVQGKAIQLVLEEADDISNRTLQQAASQLVKAGAQQYKFKRWQQTRMQRPDPTTGNSLHLRTLPTFLQLLEQFNVDMEKKEFMSRLIQDHPAPISSTQSSTGHSFEGKLELVEITNFLSVKSTQRLIFSTLNSTLYILGGLNGHGKSLLLESICWCLFGKTMRGIAGDKIIHDPKEMTNQGNAGKKTNTLKSALVKVCFQNGTVVERSRSKGKEKLNVTLPPPSEPVSRGSIKETTLYLQHYLGIDFETFLRTCMIDQDSLKAIFVPDQSRKEQNFMEAVLCLPIHHFWQVAAQLSNTLSKQIITLDVEYRSTLAALNQHVQKENEIQEALHAKWQPKLRSAQSSYDHLKREEEKHSNSKSLLLQKIACTRENLNRLHAAKYKKYLLNLKHSETEATYEIVCDMEVWLTKMITDMEKQLQLVRFTRSTLAQQSDFENNTHDLTALKQRRDTLNVELTCTLQDTYWHVVEQQNDKQKELESLTDQMSRSKTCHHQVRSLTQRLEHAEKLLSEQKVGQSLYSIASASTDQDFQEMLETFMSSYDNARADYDNLKRLTDQLVQVYRHSKQFAHSYSQLSHFEQTCLRKYDSSLYQQYECEVGELHVQLLSAKEEQSTSRSEEDTTSMLKQIKLQLDYLQNEKIHLELFLPKDLYQDKKRSQEKDRIPKDWRAEKKIVDALNEEIQLLEMRQNSRLASIADLKEYESRMNTMIDEQLAVLNEKNVSVHLHDLSLESTSIIQLEADVEKLNSYLYTIAIDQASFTSEIKLCECEIMTLSQQHTSILHEIELLQKEGKKQESSIMCLEKNHMLAKYWTQQLMPGASDGSFRHFCVTEPLKYVNRMIACNMSRLTERDPLFDATLDCVINSKFSLEQGSDARDLSARSQGQLKRNQLAAFLTLFILFREQQIFKSHFIFFDEILDSLDLPGSQSLLAWLKEEAEALDITMFVITHHIEDFETLPNIIKVEKNEENGTKYRM